MDYLVYCRDKPDTAALLERFTEAHWSFMDSYKDRLIARGPSLSEDGMLHTGSLHIVSLATMDDVGAFACQEPFYRAGVYAEVMIRRWRNLLGRTMWEFKSSSPDSLFLVLAHASAPLAHAGQGVADAKRDFLGRHRDRMVVHGSMSSIEGAHWNGWVAVIQMPARADVEAALADEPMMASAAFQKVEIHRWRMGGRR